MHVALVCPFDPRPASHAQADDHVGGVERVIAQLAREFAASGHTVTVVSSAAGNCQDTLEDGVRYRLAARRWTLFRAAIASWNSLVPRDADVVHVVGTYPFMTAPVLEHARRRGVPSVLDFHFQPSPGGLLGELAGRAHAWWVRHTFALADAVVVRSKAYGARAAGLAGVSPDRVHVVPNGVDARRFHPDASSGHGDYLLFVGRLVPYKGVEVLLDAAAALRRPRPIWVVGDGPLRSRLERRAARLGVDARFLGRVSDAALPGIYRAARVTVLPSVTRQEAFGMVLVESMACGTPVVASGLAGVADVASLGGLVAPPGDAPGLARVIDRALESGSLARGQRLASRARALFSWPRIARQFLGVYESVARGGRAAPVVAGGEVALAADLGRVAVL